MLGIAEDALHAHLHAHKALLEEDGLAEKNPGFQLPEGRGGLLGEPPSCQASA